MHSSASKIRALLAAVLLLNAVALVTVQADAQTSAPACPSKNCNKKPQAQRAAVAVNAAPADQPTAKKKGAVVVNTPPGGDQPGVQRTHDRRSAAANLALRGRRGNQHTCVGANCPAVSTNSPDNQKK